MTNLFSSHTLDTSIHVFINMFSLKPIQSLSAHFDLDLLTSVMVLVQIKIALPNTVELQWLEHLWNHKNMFRTEAVELTSLIIATGQEA